MEMMKFYHGTDNAAWEKIQEEDQLWGKREPITWEDGTVTQPERCTYLTGDALEAAQYGDVLLEVEYMPGAVESCKPVDNYDPGSWQLRVYIPIPLCRVKRLGA